MAEKFYTYRQIPGDYIDSYWALDDHTVVLGNAQSKKLPGWQKNQDVEVSVELYIKSNEIAKFIRTDRTASFYLTYHSRSIRGGTSIQGLIAKEKFSEDRGTVNLLGKIDGKKIAGVIELNLSICLDGVNGTEKQELTADEKLLASDLGATLYEETKIVILEGEQSYFPVADIDFAAKGFPHDAFYFLQRNHTSLDVDFGTAYRLYFNNKHPLFSKINESTEDESKNYLLNMIVYDTYKQLIFDALDDKEFEMPEEIDPNSHTTRQVFARLIKKLAKTYFDNASLESIREMAKSTDSNTYNKFICTLQSYLLTFGE